MMTDLKPEYERRYGSEMRFFTGRPGVARAVCHLQEGRLPGARVVDCGCGAGRSSFAFARLGARVEAFDFSAASIEVCRTLAGLQEPLQVTFSLSDALQFEPRERADLVFMLDIVEHVPDPVALLARARDWLAPGGALVVSCPAFTNLRGAGWMIMQEAFDLVMSPSDLRQIFPEDLETWGREAGFRSCRHAAGTCFAWAWSRDAATDMARRVRLAVRDKRQSDGAWEAVELHEDRLDEYLARAAREARCLVEAIQRNHGEHTRPLEPRIREGGACPFDLETVRRYLADDLNVWHDGAAIEEDFYVVTQEPWSRLGAISVFELHP